MVEQGKMVLAKTFEAVLDVSVESIRFTDGIQF